MVLRVVVLFLLFGAGEAGFVYPYCEHGVSEANFNDEPVDVILAQAPLFSTNEAIGQKGKYLNLFHTTVMFGQGTGFSRRYWTMEFDFTGGSILTSVAPSSFRANLSAPGFVEMDWTTSARYCLEEGMKWGRLHWTQRFDIVTTITAAQAKLVFSDFIKVVNNTVLEDKPQYQLWRVQKDSGDVLIKDTTCADGALWLIHHVQSVHKAKLQTGFQFSATAVVMNAESVKPVDMTNWEEVDRMVVYFKMINDVVASNQSKALKFAQTMEVVLGPKKYVYDANNKIIYEVLGNKMPQIKFEYANFPLLPPPWQGPWSNSAMLV